MFDMFCNSLYGNVRWMLPPCTGVTSSQTAIQNFFDIEPVFFL